MTFWCRINQSKQLKHLTHRLKRYYIQVPTLNYSINDTRISVVEKPFWKIVKKPTDFCNNVRFFAAPVQAQPKKEEKDPNANAPRLNDQIKAQVVRLVLEEGHKVVSRHEALECARKLGLDLVEVQRDADPPVCKVMDYHREKYTRELKAKDLAKAKADVTLRKGECKEVRFSGKIEQKDLKMKADTVKRLMERGYRVKCMALPVSQKEEGEDLGGYLSRLLALIEDIAVIESGPHLERKHAYTIIRHIKYGPTKKGGLKKLKVVSDTNAVVREASTSSPTALCEDPAEFGSEGETVTDEADMPSPSLDMRDKNIRNNGTAWSVLNSSDDFNRVFDLSDDNKGSTANFMKKEMNAAPRTAQSPANFNSSNFSHPKPTFGFSRADAIPSSPPEPSLGTENRYKRSEPRNQFPHNSMDNRGTGMIDSVRLGTQFPNQRRQPPPDMKVYPSSGETKQVGTGASIYRNRQPPSNMPNQEPSRPNVSGNQAPSYGIFSNPTANAPGNPGKAGAGTDQNTPGLKSDGGQKPDNGGQTKWGIFSR